MLVELRVGKLFFVPIFLDHQTCQKPPGGFDRSCQGSGGGQQGGQDMSLGKVYKIKIKKFAFWSKDLRMKLLILILILI